MRAPRDAIAAAAVRALLALLALGPHVAGAQPPTAPPAAAVPVAHGTARLTGTVRDSAGRPEGGARAYVRGTAAETTVRADVASAPPQYQPSLRAPNGCSVVLVWTRQ